ncbi:MAG: sigma-70 family RNA polymerase sigma factor [Candidatus Rokubacteria bacterium]|nr:sigma-70 family RNA polymerase sigma factor [Candidatus Rokubacteria bacterium]
MGRVLLGLEPRLTAVARRLVRNPEAAADVVQNAFEKVLRYCEEFRGQARPSTWMHRIVVNEAFMWLRRESRRSPARIDPGDWELVFPQAADPEQSAAAHEDRERLVQALASLPAEERSLLTASALEGRAYAALAHELGLSPGAVKSRAFRAQRRLAAELETT